MNRREFLGLMVKLAGATTILPRFERMIHPGGHRHFVSRLLVGNLVVKNLRAVIHATDGNYWLDAFEDAKLSSGLIVVKFKPLVAVTAFRTIGVTLVDERDVECSRKELVASLQPGDELRLTWEINL